MDGFVDVYYIFGIPFVYKKRKGLTTKQLQEWEAYDRIDPIGVWTDDFRIARLQALITNIALKWGAGKKAVELVSASDFMPDWTGETNEVKKQTPQQMRQVFTQFAKEHNKKVGIQTKRKEKGQGHGRRGNIDTRIGNATPGTRSSTTRNNDNVAKRE